MKNIHDIHIILYSGIRKPEAEAPVKSLGIRAYLPKPLTKRTFPSNQKCLGWSGNNYILRFIVKNFLKNR
ncbi:MAG: hypothetical protein WCO53_14480 [Deltaproteobacteria bacterium]